MLNSDRLRFWTIIGAAALGAALGVALAMLGVGMMW
jgi:F0F1-type ATP synthase membrane subunit c/vacuolar-type H+-ATPase subunit K